MKIFGAKNPMALGSPFPAAYRQHAKGLRRRGAAAGRHGANLASDAPVRATATGATPEIESITIKTA